MKVTRLTTYEGPERAVRRFINAETLPVGTLNFGVGELGGIEAVTEEVASDYADLIKDGLAMREFRKAYADFDENYKKGFEKYGRIS